ncbi:MAG: nuclear transport factor 2 family protein [Gemmatimonadetes bacterium]|nr:nuclear transport factor 2 family protein [Gemmatimonadota bacterium]
MRIQPLLVGFGLALIGRSAPAAAQSPKDDVLKTGQAVFEAMARRDTIALRRLVHPAAHLIATIGTGDSAMARVSTRDQFLVQIATMATVPIERMWNAEVRVSEGIASIWTQYDFHLGTVWSHCGIDSLQLVKTAAGWQVTSIIYTVVRPASRCKPNPLGPPR